jgi:hypothetical protein
MCILREKYKGSSLRSELLQGPVLVRFWRRNMDLGYRVGRGSNPGQKRAYFIYELKEETHF